MCSVTAALHLPPWASASIPIVSWAALLPRACLIDRQRASPQRRPMKPVDHGLSLCGVGHLDKTKATRAARVTVGHHADGLHGAIRFEAGPELLLGGCKGQIPDKNIHGA